MEIDGLRNLDVNASKACRYTTLTWLLGYTLVMRGETGCPAFRTLLSNRVITLWSLAVVASCVLVSTVPAVQRVLKTVPVPTADWAWIIGLALLGALGFSLLGGLIPSRLPQETLKKVML